MGTASWNGTGSADHAAGEHGIVGRSPALLAVLREVRLVAATDATVLIGLDFARALRVIPGQGPALTAESARRVLTMCELQQIERNNLLLALELTGWRVSGAGGAAQLLGINPSTLASRIKALGLQRQRPKPDAPRQMPPLQAALPAFRRSPHEVHHA